MFHPFEKILYKYNFFLFSCIEKEFVGKPYKEYTYRKEGVEDYCVIAVWPHGNYENIHHYYKQSNGIFRFNRCETNYQLNESLFRSLESRNG
jgi:hypothetical protein